MDFYFVVDFGTSFLKSVIFSPAKDGVKVSDFSKFSYNPSSKFDLEIKLKGLISKLKGKANFNFATLGIGEGIGKGKIKRAVFLRKNPKIKITKKELEKIIKIAQRDTFFEVGKEFKGRKIIPVLAKIKKVMVDREEVLSPIGLRGEEIFFKIMNFYLPLDFYKRLKKIFLSFKINLSFEYIPEVLSNFHFLQYSNQKKTSFPKYIGSKNKIFIDIGGKSTQICNFKNGEIDKIYTVPLGGDEIVEKFIRDFKVKKEDLIFRGGEITVGFKKGREMPLFNIQQRIQEILKENYQEWKIRFQDIVEDFEKEYLPLEIYLFGGGSYFLSLEKLRKDLAKFPCRCIIKKISPLDLKSILNFDLDDSQATIPLLICINSFQKI